jgi:predicted amidohydrolase
MLKFFSGGAGSGYTQQQKLTASDLDTNDFFGFSASLSSDGNTAIVGAPQEDTSPNTDNGAAYVFTRSGSVWTQQQKLLASDAASDDLFGVSVALSLDGNTAIVGAQGESTSPYTSNGAAYVFTRSGSTWTEQQKLVGSGSVNQSRFGVSVSLSSDGNTAIVGAYTESTSPFLLNGAAYVFTRSGSTWTEQQKLTASDIEDTAQFGVSVSISANGNTAIIGANLEDTSPNLNNGAAYVFTRSGSTWTEQQKLLASDAASNDQFGFSVSLSSDGNTAIVGSPQEDTSPKTDNGAAYVFTRSGSTWTEQQKLLATDIGSGDFFGRSVAISPDGNTVIVGATQQDTPPTTNNGAAYIFTRSGVTWSQQQKLLASDAANDDAAGRSVALSADGNTAVVGASIEDTPPYTNNGAAYIFVA